MIKNTKNNSLDLVRDLSIDNRYYYLYFMLKKFANIKVHYFHQKLYASGEIIIYSLLNDIIDIFTYYPVYNESKN